MFIHRPSFRLINLKSIKALFSRPLNNEEQSHQKNKNPSYKKLNPEQISEMLEKIKKSPGFSENSLRATMEEANNTYLIIISTSDGQILRRITEEELGELYFKNAFLDKGKILNKKI